MGVLQEIRLDRLKEILLSDPEELNRDQTAAALGSLNRGRKESGLVTLLARVARRIGKRARARFNHFSMSR